MHTQIYLIYIPVIPDTEGRSEIAKIINNFNPIQEYFVKTYNINPYFYEQYKKCIFNSFSHIFYDFSSTCIII